MLKTVRIKCEGDEDLIVCQAQDKCTLGNFGRWQFRLDLSPTRRDEETLAKVLTLRIDPLSTSTIRSMIHRVHNSRVYLGSTPSRLRTLPFLTLPFFFRGQEIELHTSRTIASQSVSAALDCGMMHG
jgi:hypothetical protein